MRSLTTLYKIAYGRIMWAKDGDYRGMCHLIDTLERDKLITLDEWIKLRENLLKNRPTEWLHLEFAALDCYDWDDGDYWFPPGEMEVRKRFLHKMINYSRPWYVKLYLLWKDQLK
jgi:hypothetical protein